MSSSRKTLGLFRFPIKKGLGKTMLTWFLAISLVPLLTVSYLSYRNAYTSLAENAEKSIKSVAHLKKVHIKNFFSRVFLDITQQANTYGNVTFLERVERAFEASGVTPQEFVKSDTWEMITDYRSRDLRAFAVTNGYDAIYFVDREGNVLYSTLRGSDLGENVFRGVLSGTIFGKAARKAWNEGRLAFSDVGFYEPAQNDLTTFVVSPVKDQQGKKIGLIAARFSLLPLSEVLRDPAGMGKTGDTYLLGRDLYLRSSSRFFEENDVLKVKVDTEIARMWLREMVNKGKQSKYAVDDWIVGPATYLNVRGEKVFGVVHPVTIGDVVFGLVSEISYDEAFAPVFRLQKIFILLLGITVFVVLVLSVEVTRRLVSPLIKLTELSKKVARGILEPVKLAYPDNEIGVLAKHFGEVVESYRDISAVCQAIAEGDLSQTVEVRDERDVLSQSVNRMCENLRTVVKQANHIAAGDYTVEVKPRSEKDELGSALYRMTSKLREVMAELERESWIKTGKSELSDVMRGDQDLKTLSKNIINFVARYLDAQAGAIFVREEGEVFKLMGSYAYTMRKGVSLEYRIGEGLVGQCALEGERIIVTDVPPDYMIVESGLGMAPPRYLLLQPVELDGEVKAVLELASFLPFRDHHLEFLNQVKETMAVALGTAEARMRINELLEKYREQSEKLQAQQEELQQINEELEEQARVLKESEARLQAQQEELQQANQELEERTIELQRQRDEIKKKNEELERARALLEQKTEELEKANRYKSEFLANMSHELRSPLNSVIVLSQLLADNPDGNLTGKQVEFAETINRSAKDLLSLINDILDLSKVEAGRLEMTFESFPLGELVRDLENLFSPVAEMKSLEFKVEMEKGLPEKIVSDRHRLAQVLRNLLSNAFKFTEKGEVKLKVFTPEPGKVAFSVEDTGIGIPAEKQEVIFEAFRQADGTTARKYGGTGLGLSISRKLAELLKGEILLESEAGKGSKFTLVIPVDVSLADASGSSEDSVESSEVLREDAEVVVSEETEASPAEKGEAGRREEKLVIKSSGKSREKKDKTILIVEDEEDFASLLSEIARDRGFTCLIAETGEKALKFARFYRPDGIILDLGLPDMDGMDLLKKLREDPSTRAIPVHIVSASDRKAEGVRLGAIGFFTKPLKIDRLKEVLDRMESFVDQPFSNILVVTCDGEFRDALSSVAGNGGKAMVFEEECDRVMKRLKGEHYECLILDLDSAHECYMKIMEAMKTGQLSPIPVIVYSKEGAVGNLEKELVEYSDHFPIVWSKSLDLVLDEVRLFVHKVLEEGDAFEPEDGFTAREAGGGSSRGRVLLVDDDTRNAFAIKSLLENLGVDVDVVSNGEEALRYLSAGGDDVRLILMDIMMPVMDGIEAIKRIRTNEKWKHIPIIALTAKAMKGDREKCLSAGANDYLSKPVDVKKLTSLVKVYL